MMALDGMKISVVTNEHIFNFNLEKALDPPPAGPVVENVFSGLKTNRVWLRMK
jgi:hypothetical protein